MLYNAFPNADTTRHRLFVSTFHLVEMEITPDTLTLRALDRDREILDTFVMEKKKPHPDVRFIRGDVDFNGRLNIVDAVALLNYLFAGGPLECPAVATMRASGEPPQLSDAIQLLNHLFLAGRAPDPPFPDCGPAPDADDERARAHRVVRRAGRARPSPVRPRTRLRPRHHRGGQ